MAEVNGGKSVREVSEKFGIHKQTLYNRLRKKDK